MSSYLLAFVVSDLDFISNTDDKLLTDTLHRVWVRPDSLSKAQYGLDSSVKVLKALEEYVGVKFNLSKIDSAGVPNKGGAMENWGMVTYRFVDRSSLSKYFSKRFDYLKRKRDGLRRRHR